ncbi:MAG: nickel pincer cofactor biosynthesis protein LarC [Clostridiales bacterium]|nr:nickel pincer cofactor biosynthesis protein LarC [Clostridiales bacterium]
MSNTLYLECNAGISGDMTVAALLDLGASQEVLMKALDSIPVQGFSVAISRVKKSGIDCCDFNVILDADYENHDHDMEYLHDCDYVHHGHEHHHHGDAGHDHEHHENNHHHEGEEHDRDHSHHREDEEQEHSHHHHKGEEHEHSHHHGDEGHTHIHRGMKEVTEIIQGTTMTESARKIALHIFNIIARAEAKAHGLPVDQVHFHEVGAIDSIVDVLAVAVCLDDLQLDGVIVPKLCEGTGTVRCQHGILPIPVPAVANIVQENGLNLEILPVQGEFVTPTGAAIVAAVKTSDCLPKSFRIKKIGIGAGKRSYERPSMLRAMLIEPVKRTVEEISADSPEDCVYRLETNIDDCSGEILGYTMELLFAAGARDVHYHPVYMKKNRPAWQLNVLCDEKDISRMEEIIFRETTTIGIRRVCMERTVLSRESRQVEIPYGTAKVKVCRYGSNIKYYPEYESVKVLCQETGRSYQEVYRDIVCVCEKQS